LQPRPYRGRDDGVRRGRVARSDRTARNAFCNGTFSIWHDANVSEGPSKFARLRRHRAGAAIVFHGTERPRASDIVGVITKRAIADTVIDSFED
jgi:hypothetical protein